MFIYMFLYIYICLYMFIYICLYIYVYIYVYIYIYIYKYNIYIVPIFCVLRYFKNSIINSTHQGNLSFLFLIEKVR